MGNLKIFAEKSLKFLRVTFGPSAIFQAVIIAIIVMVITNYCNDINIEKNNYSRLRKELEWNLSELKQYDALLKNIETYLENKKDISVKSRTFFNPIFKSFPLRFQTKYYIDENEDSGQLDETEYDIQTRNYIVFELSKSGFLYNLENKEQIKYLEKMSSPNWFSEKVAPIKEILHLIDNLPKPRNHPSKKTVVELKRQIEIECEKIIVKVRNSRSVLAMEISHIEGIIVTVNEKSG